MRAERRRLLATGDEPAARRMAKAARKAGSKEASCLTYYTAHAQGKAAIRLRPCPGRKPFDPLPRAGIHKFTLASHGSSHRCEGAGAPVILHYPNATFNYWVRKYEMLTVDPAFGAGTQISLKNFGKLAASLEKTISKSNLSGDGEGGGVVSDEAAAAAIEDADIDKGTTQGMHALAAAIIARGDLKLAKALYRLYFCIVDSLPMLAANGLLVEITFVSQLLADLDQK